MKTMKHTMSVLVRNKFGALTRIAALFSGRGYNIDSLSVATTKDLEVSKMTIVTSGDADTIEQIEKQLTKLVDVIQVTPLKGQKFVARELMLVKIAAQGATRSEIMQVCDVFGAAIVSLHHNTMAVQITGKPDKLDAFIQLVETFGVVEIVRSGPIGMIRADEPTQSFSL